MKKIFVTFLILLTFSCTSKKETNINDQKINPQPNQAVSRDTESHNKEVEAKIKEVNATTIKIEPKTESSTAVTSIEKTSKNPIKAVNIQNSTPSQNKIEKRITETPVVKTTPQKKIAITKKSAPATPVVAKKEEKEVILKKPNHELWNKLTKVNVTRNGKVNYKGFKNKLTQVSNYLNIMEKMPPQENWSKNEKLAYWFNLYNASTVYLVASNYPIKSIKAINGGKPWDKKFIKSGSNTYSLNDIENVIVRPHYNEPRLHVAFNCAAASCPNLLNEAFDAQKLNSQLNSLAKKWINDPTKNQISENTIAISQIFNWYKGDFREGVIPFINTFSSNTKITPNATISYLEYDWKLNE